MSESGSFIVPKKALEDAMKLLNAIPTRNGITSSEFIKTELTSKNHLRMSLASELSGDAILPVSNVKNFKAIIYLDRRMLNPFVAAGTELTSSDIYEFTVEKNQISVKNGVRNAHLESNESASGYEKMPSLSDALSIELKEEWTSIATCATLCACSDPIAPALNCIHIQPDGNKVFIRASDTHRVFQGSISAGSFPCDKTIALPLELVDRLDLFSTGVCHYSSRWTMLQFPVGNIWQAVKTECRKSFPVENISKIVTDIVKKGTVVSVLGTQSLVDAADRISGYLQSAMRDDPVLTITMTKGKKKAQLSSKTIGAAFNESILLESKAEQDYVVEWPLQAVLPILQYCKKAGSAKILQDESGKSCLKAGRVTYVVGKKEKAVKKKKVKKEEE